MFRSFIQSFIHSFINSCIIQLRILFTSWILLNLLKCRPFCPKFPQPKSRRVRWIIPIYLELICLSNVDDYMSKLSNFDDWAENIQMWKIDVSDIIDIKIRYSYPHIILSYRIKNYFDGSIHTHTIMHRCQKLSITNWILNITLNICVIILTEAHGVVGPLSNGKDVRWDLQNFFGCFLGFYTF